MTARHLFHTERAEDEAEGPINQRRGATHHRDEGNRARS